jgi:acetyl-CoA C-acetyltransferase
MDPRTPVLVGAAAVWHGDAEAAELMVQALEAAAADATTSAGNARRLLGAIDRIAVPQGTWGYTDPARLVARSVGATVARTHLGEVGVPQQTLVTSALQALAAGESEVAVVVGGEARAWAKRARAAGRTDLETPQTERPDVTEMREPDFMAPPEVTAGLMVPVQQYAMIENALRHADGVGLDEHRRQVAELWARFNQVAGTNPHAAFGTPRSPESIAQPDASNFPLSFPYNKWHASQWTVDQAAALIFCSAESADRYRVPIDRRIHPLVGLDSGHAVSLSARRELHRWPAMATLAGAAEGRLGHPLSEIDLAEVYSCFPVAVRVQQRELRLPADGTPTVTGGMAFAGGPFNNFTYQATCEMVGRLRAEPERRAMVTTVCGLLTKPGLAVWSATPDGDEPFLADLSPPARSSRGSVPVVAEHHGTATVATYTVTFEGGEPAVTKVIGDVAADTGRVRCVAVCEDRLLARQVLEDEFIGATVSVEGTTFRT